MSNFVNLHVHSYYSLLDGLSNPEHIVKKVKRMNQPGVAITEHGNVFSAVKMYKLCTEHSLKFIYGCELYVTENRFEKDKNNKYYHLTVLAYNEQGRINLNKLVSLGWIQGFYYKPRVDNELLNQYKDGLIVLSGCMASELQKTLWEKGYEKGREVAMRYRQMFGENYFLEVQSHRDERQQKLNRQIVDIGKELGIPWVCTADSHFVDEEDLELHSIFIQIGRNQEPGETYMDTQLQSEEEARQMLKPGLSDEEIDIAIRNTMIILDKCQVKVPLSAPIIPHVEVPDGFNSEEEYLQELCRQGWIKRGIHKLPIEEQKKYRDRLRYEYKAITEMGFAGYYLLVQSYANTVKRRGIARGSGGGSLVAYLLNIVDIDPIKYGLYFERFIDVGALELLREGKITKKELKVPDVDLDFGCEDREKVIKYIVDTYGKDRVACLGTFQYIWDRLAIKDVGRVLGIPFEVTNQITKELGDRKLKDAPDLIEKWGKKYPKLFSYAEKLAGAPKSFSMHPCGRVVTIDELTQYTAVTESNGEIVLQADMKDAEELGLVKIDTLGLRTVDVIYDVLEMIGKDYDYIAPHNHTFDDPKVMEVFQNGHTDGVFQFESPGMKKTLINMKPTSLDDLGVANALYRPGAMKYIDNYIRRKHGEEEFEYLHPDLEPILKPTFGIIVFQEQLIAIGRLAGLRNPDTIRKATSKKDAELLAKIEPELREGLYKRGWTKEQIDQLWNDVVDFGNYSFNKSHSYAYAIIAYITAFLKAYHPTEFACALLNSYEGKLDEIETCIKEAQRLGVEFAKPTFRNVSPLCKIEDGKIVYGLSLIKHCNRKMAEELQQFKDKRYNHFVELLVDIVEKTTINSRQLETLIYLDYFSEFGNNKSLMRIYEAFKDGKGIKYDKKHKEATKAKRIADLIQFEIDELQRNEKYSLRDQLVYEKQMYGFVKTLCPKAKATHAMVVEIDRKYKNPLLTLRQLKTGKTTNMKVKAARFEDMLGNEQLTEGDIIEITYFNEEYGWTKDENGKWIQTKDKKDKYLVSCIKLSEDILENIR